MRDVFGSTLMLTAIAPLPSAEWPYAEVLVRLGLALALGLLIGLERERRGKEAGLRTFGFVALLGALGSPSGHSCPGHLSGIAGRRDRALALDRAACGLGDSDPDCGDRLRQLRVMEAVRRTRCTPRLLWAAP